MYYRAHKKTEVKRPEGKIKETPSKKSQTGQIYPSFDETLEKIGETMMKKSLDSKQKGKKQIPEPIKNKEDILDSATVTLPFDVQTSSESQLIPKNCQLENIAPATPPIYHIIFQEPIECTQCQTMTTDAQVFNGGEEYGNFRICSKCHENVVGTQIAQNE